MSELPKSARPILSLPGYFADEDGGIWSVSGERVRQLKTSIKAGRYPGLTIRGETWTIHRLMALAFLGKPPKGALVMHRDDNPLNNHISNIVYGTVLTNAYSAWTNGRTLAGESKPNAKLTEEDVRKIRTEYATTKSRSLSALARDFGVSVMTIRRIVRREKWTHVD